MAQSMSSNIGFSGTHRATIRHPVFVLRAGGQNAVAGSVVVQTVDIDKQTPNLDREHFAFICLCPERCPDGGG